MLLFALLGQRIREIVRQFAARGEDLHEYFMFSLVSVTRALLPRGTNYYFYATFCISTLHDSLACVITEQKMFHFAEFRLANTNTLCGVL